MNKVRVYELAKELNTTSKRLMEKLNEINVEVKNHMSLLEDNELAALYKHIGVVKHDENENKGSGDKKPMVSTVQAKHEASKDPKKNVKSAPRIIRTTEIVVDTKNEAPNEPEVQKKEFQRRDTKPTRRTDFVRYADANSGLRAGYVRDMGIEHNSEAKSRARQDERKDIVKQEATRDINQESKKELKQDVNNIVQEPKKEIIKENGEDANTVVNSTTQQNEKIVDNNSTANEVIVDDSNKTQQTRSYDREKRPIDQGNKTVETDGKQENSSQEDIRSDSRPDWKKGRDGESDNVRPQGQNASGRPWVDRPQGDRPSYNRPQGDRPQGDRPQGDRPQGDRPYNNRPQGDRPQGDRPYNRPWVDRSQGDRPQGDRPYNNRPQGDRPQGDRPQGDRPQGDRPQGDRPQGDRPYSRPWVDRPQGDRPQGDRPQGDRPYNNRPQGDRPQGDRPQGDRPYSRPWVDRPQGDRPQGDRPYNNRPQGDRPQGDRPQGDRPYSRPWVDRPQGDRPQGDRPYNNRPQGDRPQGDRPYNRPWVDRPQGDRPQGDRPQGDRPYNRPWGDRPQGDRPQGDRPQGGNYGNRQGNFRSAQKPLEIPKSEMSDAQKEELNSLRNEQRREFQNKDVDKDVKRDQKKDAPKATPPGKNERFKPHQVIVGQKKGVNEVLSEDFILNEFYSDDGSKKKNRRPIRGKRDMRGNNQPSYHKIAVLTSITIGETITVKELAESLKKTSADVIKKLIGLGIMATLNQELDFDTATIIAEEYGIKTEKAVVINDEDILFDDADDADEDMVPRPPVVVVMGHVDHGKTSLLDAIRETHVIESEAGGITQHIGAYMVKVNDRNITFLDTPGHEAFTAMRARGAQVTDIAILVVAADDGVMPQTIEAINHAKAANVSIIVAINKIDKPGANPDRVKQELTEHGIVAEEWGGDAIMVPVSAKNRENIDQLLEMVLLAADMLELKSNPNKQAKGTVIEAKLDKERGPVATVLVQRGTLKIGDSIVTGSTVGRIRAMTDDKGKSAREAGPSNPVEILGLPKVPEAGEIFYAITDEKVAKHLAETRKFKQREQHLKSSAMVTLEDLYAQIKEGKVKDLNLIVKADVQGSVEAVKQSLAKLTNEEVRVKIIHGGVGAITESDVTLAQVSNAIIIGFNVRPGANVDEFAKNADVDLRLYSIIYKAIEDVQAAMKGMLEPTFKEVIQGHVEIRQLFKVSTVGTIAGSYVTDGKITRNSDVRILRGGVIVFVGKLASLKRFKDDAKEVAQGFECGLSIEKFNDLKEGDIVESYVMEQVER